MTVLLDMKPREIKLLRGPDFRRILRCLCRLRKIRNFLLQRGVTNQLAYGSNKEALRGLTKIAAKEWGQYGICVNIVLPGAESPAAKAWAEKFPEEYAKQVNLNPMKRFGDPEKDIAPVIAFLAGPDSCYFSGQSVIVDGANSIMP